MIFDVFILPGKTKTPVKIPKQFNYQTADTFVALLALDDTLGPNMRHLVGISRVYIGSSAFEFGFLLPPSVLGTNVDIRTLLLSPDFMWYENSIIMMVGSKREDLDRKIRSTVTINEYCFINPRFRPRFLKNTITAFHETFSVFKTNNRPALWKYFNNNTEDTLQQLPSTPSNDMTGDVVVDTTTNTAIANKSITPKLVADLVKDFPWETPSLCRAFFDALKYIIPSVSLSFEIQYVADNFMQVIHANLEKHITAEEPSENWLSVERDYYLVVKHPVESYIEGLMTGRGYVNKDGKTKTDLFRDLFMGVS